MEALKKEARMKRGAADNAAGRQDEAIKTHGAKPRGGTPGKTATCMHCRYERPAADTRCHICGYPWPWMKR